MKFSLGFLSLSLALAALACSPKKKSKNQDPGVNVNDSGINSTDANPFEFASNTVHFTKAMNGKLPSPFLIKDGSLFLSFDLNTVSTLKETNRIRPLLDVTLVLDITSSMGVQLEAARKGFRKFQDSVKAEGFDARYSLLTFEDLASSATSFTDVNSFQTRLAKVDLGDGDDIAEGSLLALQNALKEGATKSMEAVPVILLVTDAVGHNGGGTRESRDCTLEKTLEAFASPYGKAAKFFYAVPDFKAKGSGDCYAESTNAQYNKLFAKVSEQTPNVYRGHALAWPFQESTLSTELPKLIVEQVTEKAISCPARKYSMTKAGAVISSADESHWTLNAQGNPAIGPLVAGAELDALVGKDLKIDITRCCDQTPDPSGSCKSEYIQSIEFQLQK